MVFVNKPVATQGILKKPRQLTVPVRNVLGSVVQRMDDFAHGQQPRVDADALARTLPNCICLLQLQRINRKWNEKRQVANDASGPQ